MSKQVMQQGLDALEGLFGGGGGVAVWRLGGSYQPQQAIEALRAAIAAQEPEPVGSVYTMEALVPGGCVRHHASLTKALPAGTMLYAAPPDTEALRAELERVKGERDAMAADSARIDFMEAEAKKEGMLLPDGNLRRQVDYAIAKQGEGA